MQLHKPRVIKWIVIYPVKQTLDVCFMVTISNIESIVRARLVSVVPAVVLLGPRQVGKTTLAQDSSRLARWRDVFGHGAPGRQAAAR